MRRPRDGQGKVPKGWPQKRIDFPYKVPLADGTKITLHDDLELELYASVMISYVENFLMEEADRAGV